MIGTFEEKSVLVDDGTDIQLTPSEAFRELEKFSRRARSRNGERLPDATQVPMPRNAGVVYVTREDDSSTYRWKEGTGIRSVVVEHFREAARNR
jgi:hypothetical protein